MAKQRLVIWSLYRLLPEDKDEPVVIDLDYEPLIKRHLVVRAPVHHPA